MALLNSHDSGGAHRTAQRGEPISLRPVGRRGKVKKCKSMGFSRAISQPRRYPKRSILGPCGPVPGGCMLPFCAARQRAAEAARRGARLDARAVRGGRDQRRDAGGHGDGPPLQEGPVLGVGRRRGPRPPRVARRSRERQRKYDVPLVPRVRYARYTIVDTCVPVSYRLLRVGTLLVSTAFHRSCLSL